MFAHAAILRLNNSIVKNNENRGKVPEIEQNLLLAARTLANPLAACDDSVRRVR
jgi:hypothetical protein